MHTKRMQAPCSSLVIKQSDPLLQLDVLQAYHQYGRAAWYNGSEVSMPTDAHGLPVPSVQPACVGGADASAPCIAAGHQPFITILPDAALTSSKDAFLSLQIASTAADGYPRRHGPFVLCIHITHSAWLSANTWCIVI
jgi:hypothetical protein